MLAKRSTKHLLSLGREERQSRADSVALKNCSSTLRWKQSLTWILGTIHQSQLSLFLSETSVCDWGLVLCVCVCDYFGRKDGDCEDLYIEELVLLIQILFKPPLWRWLVLFTLLSRLSAITTRLHLSIYFSSAKRSQLALIECPEETSSSLMFFLIATDKQPCFHVKTLSKRQRLLRASMWLGATCCSVPMPFHSLCLSLLKLCFWVSLLWFAFLWCFACGRSICPVIPQTTCCCWHRIRW